MVIPVFSRLNGVVACNLRKEFWDESLGGYDGAEMDASEWTPSGGHWSCNIEGKGREFLICSHVIRSIW